MAATAMRSAFHGRVLMPLAYFCLGDARFELLDELLERDGWSMARIREHQGDRLTRLLHVCAFHNPYWSEVFRRYGVRANADDPFAELAKLPVLTKDELRANWRRMRSTHLPERSVRVETTSGSTGMQVHVYLSRYYEQLHAAMEFRIRAWMGIVPGDRYLSIQSHGTHHSTRKRVLRRVRTAVENGMIIDAGTIDPADTLERLRRAAESHPAHVHGYASGVAAMARLSQAHGLKWPGVRAVSTTAEQLLEEDRATIEQAFGAPVYDRYGSREVMSISMQCEQGRHHVFADVNIVEFADIDESDGELQAVVVTPLDNEAMPLLRYRNGDSAAAVAGACACGRALPLMTACRGRICNNFLAPDGRLVTGTYFRHFFFHQEGYRGYQWHQTARDHIDLYVAPEGGTLTAEQKAHLARVREQIERDFPAQFHLDVHVVPEVPRTAGGKHMWILSDLLRNQ